MTAHIAYNSYPSNFLWSSELLVTTAEMRLEFFLLATLSAAPDSPIGNQTMTGHSDACGVIATGKVVEAIGIISGDLPNNQRTNMANCIAELKNSYKMEYSH